MSADFDKSLRPKVGVAAIVLNEKYPNCVLLGKRKGGVVGSGTYQLPGGHLEHCETLVDCAKRETLEETNIKLKNVRFGTMVNSFKPDVKFHYITIFMIGDINEEHRPEPENMEPDKCESWSWCNWDEFPCDNDELFYCLADIKRNGYTPFGNNDYKIL